VNSRPASRFEDSKTDPGSLSKRAARRLIQRAFVLAGRDRVVRQHIREAQLTTLWVLEDWHLQWTLVLHHGKFNFERRRAKNPDLILTWKTATAFFTDAQAASRARPWVSAAGNETGAASAIQLNGDPSQQRVLEPVYYAFCAALREVLAKPVDENGDPLL